MTRKPLIALAFAGGALATALAFSRYRPLLIGMAPRFLKEAVKNNKALQIAYFASQGALYQEPPSPEEAARILHDWETRGRPLPGPGTFKHAVLRAYGQQFGLKTLVETGTYTGDTPAALKGDFDRIYSVELSRELARRAKKWFRHDSHITILQGDSTHRLPNVLMEISEPALFWLDGHYSGA